MSGRRHLAFKRRGGHSKDRPVSQAARFWPTPRLLALAAEHGVDKETVREDFRRRPDPRKGSRRAPKVRDPLRLKPIPAHPGAKGRGRLPIDPGDPIAAHLRAQVEAANAFANTVAVEGCAPPRWFRLFFGDLRLYGRMHALGGGNYQGLRPGQRLALRIGGEPVVEIDLRASMVVGQFGRSRMRA